MSASHWFNWVHGNNLVYNTCWEDPRIDREALDLSPNDQVLMITSAGCNALDYALLGPKGIHAVDVNYRQNALLELKIAGIRRLEFETYFDMFGRGRCDDFTSLYARTLRPDLSGGAKRFWDSHTYYFSNGHRRRGLYYHGTSGGFAWMVNVYLNRAPKLRDGIDEMLNAGSVEEQQRIYFGWFRDAFWKPFIRWIIRRDAALSLLGVPAAQRVQVERYYEGGIAQFVEECIEAVFAHLPLGDNYFWRVYLAGQYSPECCPEYLKADNFYRLKNGLVDSIELHTATLEQFLSATRMQFSRFVLLDHMDWMSAQSNGLLQREWQQIVRHAAPEARIIWRSGGLKVDFVDSIAVEIAGKARSLGEFLRYDEARAKALHQRDRVHTYGSFYIADLMSA